MAKKTIKVRAKHKAGQTTVKALMTHPMETGQRKGKDGKPIPAHFIQEVECTVGGKTVMTASWGTAVSKNPYLSFKFDGGAGETVALKWTDNMGKSDMIETKVS